VIRENVKRGCVLSEILVRQFQDPGIFGRCETPEFNLPKGMKRGSREHLKFITLLAPLSYIRDFGELHKAACRTYEDPETRFLFSAKEVLKKTDTEVFEAMIKHNLGKRRYKEVMTYIIPFARSLMYLHDGDPYHLLARYSFDAYEMYEEMKGKLSTWFPYLSGPKILPMYLRMISKIGLPIRLKHLERIPIPVDVHTARATFRLGCMNGSYNGVPEGLYPQIQQYWFAVSKKVNLISLDIDSPLWTLSKYGCRTRRETYCPKEKLCYFNKFCKNGFYKPTANNLEINMEGGE